MAESEGKTSDENKTSDEIINELFSSLNLPLSPKIQKSEDSESNNEVGGNDSFTDDEDSDGRSSESNDKEKDRPKEVDKNEKHKVAKKKKEKRKKKRKRKKKEDRRHKHKKKKRKNDVPSSECKDELDESNSVVKDINEDLVKKMLTQENVNQDHRTREVQSPSVQKEDKSSSKSTKIKEKSGSKRKSRSRSCSKDEPQRKHGKSDKARRSNSSSASRSYSRSRSNRHSRSRSTSRVRQRYSSSRSRSRSSKYNRYSRSCSKSKSNRRRSRTKSPLASDRRKRRKSRSYSGSLSPKFSKRRRSSKSYSRSCSPKMSSRRRSRSLTRRGPTYPDNKSDVVRKSQEISQKHEPTNPQTDIDLSSIPTPSSRVSETPRLVGAEIALDSIPLPVPAPAIPDPSCIPLPQPVSHSEITSKKEEVGRISDLETIPVPAPTAAVAQPKEVNTPKAAEHTNGKPEEGAEKSKSKTIIIKSLKDSLVFMQAQEEAERRAKEIANKEDSNMDEENDSEEKDEEEKKAESDPEEKNEGSKGSEVESEQEYRSPEAEVNNLKDLKEEEELGKEGSANGLEEGEIASDEEEEVVIKVHKKKSKKDKDASKEKKKLKKDKEKHREEKKKKKKDRKSRSRSKSQENERGSKETKKFKKHSRNSRELDSHRHKSHHHSRSRSRDRSSRTRRRSFSRSRSRSWSRSRRSRSRSRGRRRWERDCVSDLRDKVTRKRLLEIARRNAVYLMQNGCLPPSVEQEQLVNIKAGGKSVEELTDFCKQLVASGNYSDVELSDAIQSSGEDNDNPDKPFTSSRHPFSIKDSKPILMNIRNAPMLPTKTNAERLADQAKLREQFPVSSGSQHRTKGELTSEGKLTESGWVPVSPKESTKKEDDKVFTKTEPAAMDISQIVSSRLSAIRKLQDNPHDMEAQKVLQKVQKEMTSWALSKQEPGQFTGSTGAKVLSQEELASGQQAWARKEQFKEAAPVQPHFGMKMLQKMGWTPGEGLGKNKEGALEPLLLDVKMDKKGFHAQEELAPKKPPIPLAKDLSGKHPVSALVELCSKRKWSPPEFEMVFDCGPDHKKNFLMKVIVNGHEFKPSVAASSKKLAKANAAAAYLQSLGLLPKDPANPL